MNHGLLFRNDPLANQRVPSHPAVLDCQARQAIKGLALYSIAATNQLQSKI